MNNNGTILIVLYNKKIEESQSYISLISQDIEYNNIDLLIWNNGPKQISPNTLECIQHRFNSIELIETIDNQALSVIYNKASVRNTENFLIILDDDSSLSKEYIENALTCKSEQCLVPLITHNNTIQSPRIKKKKVSSLELPKNRDGFVSISSGLVIGSNIRKELKTHFGDTFDERFYLYGIDTTFCLRLGQLKLLNSLHIIPGFEHSYSKMESESKTVTEFRMKERAYDEGLRVRYYKSKPSMAFNLVKRIFRLLFDKVLKKSNLKNTYIIDAILSGKHYKNQ
jgi:GT2 family glycosyltransferase